MTALKLRMRPDLVLTAQGTDADRRWLVHDPVTLEFFRLRDEECSILRMLNGRASLEEIRTNFERQFAPLRLGVQQLQAFLYRLHEFGLVLGDAPGQGEVLSRRQNKRNRTSFAAGISNPLAIRLPGISARPVIDAIYPYVKWTFSPAASCLWLLIVASAIVLLFVELGAVQSRLPDFATFFNVRTATWFAIALISTKALHELGHALMCRHFGGSCREFGLMLLLFMPTFYCDVSDAWRLPSKWQRMLVSAAGMLVELVVAAVATWLWWLSAPSTLNAICLRIMFLCSASTLVFNLNPLLRFDGYYILSDWLDIPNLWQESRSLWRRLAWNWLSKTEAPPDPTIPRRMYPALMIYALLSAAYSCLLVVGMMWFCWRILEPQGLGTLAIGLSIFTVGGMVAGPLYGVASRWSRPTFGRGVDRGRASLVVIATTALLVGIGLIPLPHRIAAPAWLEADGAETVYVSIAGHVQDAIRPAVSVKKDEPLVHLQSADVLIRLADLESEASQEKLRLKNLRIMLNDDPTVAPLIPAAEKSLEDAQVRLQQAREDQDRLILKSPRDGSVLPPPEIAAPIADSRRLTGWHGTPLDEGNRGCFLETGTAFCQIGDPNRMEALLVIEQSEISFVRLGQRVRLRIDQGPAGIVTGTVSEVAKTDAGDIPDPLARLLDLPLRRDAKTGLATAATYYQARVKLEPSDLPLAVGMHGQAKILADWQPLGTRLLRWLQLTFRL
jgi:putative peptide zinc metalloprotease protein